MTTSKINFEQKVAQYQRSLWLYMLFELPIS